MRELLIVKEKIKKFVGKNAVLIIPLLKFLMTFAAISKINGSIGYMTKLSNSAITLIVALAGSFLPINLTLVILALIIVAHIYKLSFECAIIILVLFVVMFLLYFRFASRESVGAMLVPLSFVFKVPYVMPISLGLVGTPSSMVSTACGVIVYQVLHFIRVNADNLKTAISEDSSKLGGFKAIVDALISDKSAVVLAVAFAATVLVVYLIRRLPISYSWFIAIGLGAVTCLIAVVVGNSVFNGNVSVGTTFVGLLISIILNIILQYFCFDLDYNRTERVQFEDDEYYYYVKAVPKNTIRLSDNGKKKVTPKEPVVREKVAPRKTSRGPLGMSGGRPAGEGRKKD